MADEAEFDIIMNSVEAGDVNMITDASENLSVYNDQLSKTSSAADETSESVSKTAEQLKAEAEAANSASKSSGEFGISLTTLNSALEIGQKALGYLEKGYSATIGKAMEYGETVRNISTISGQSAEESSRMIQVLDDWQVSSGNVETALRKMTANGLTPNLDTIATLGEQYRSIQDPMEKNKFILDNLGASGQNWNQVLGQTREQLMAASAAVSDNLVLNQKQLDQLDQLRQVQDGIGDTYDSIAISIGTNLAPIMAGHLTALDRAIKGESDWGENIKRTNGLALFPIINAAINYNDALAVNEYNLNKAKEAEKQKTDVTLSAAEAERIAKEETDARNAVLSTQIALAGTIQSQMDSYSSTQNGLIQQAADLRAQMASTNPWETEKIQGYRDKLVEISEKMKEAAATNTEAMAKIRIDNLQAKLAVDGISDADYNLIIAEQLKAGIITEAAAAQSVAMNTLNTQLAEHIITQEQYDKAVADGSLKVTSANSDVALSDQDKSKAIQENNAAAATKVDELTKKTQEASVITKKTNDEAILSWRSWENSVSDSILSVVDYLQQLIDKINEAAAAGALIPTAAGAGATGQSRTESATAQGAVLRGIVDITVNGTYQKSVTLR